MPSKTPYEIFRRALVIDGTKYGGPVPLSNLILDESRVVNLANEKELQLHFRTMGIGARGYKSGWFKLRNGRNALVLITETSKVLCIPTTSDYVLLLSADDPESLISALREGNATKFEQKTA